MRHELRMDGGRFSLAPARAEDAAFILSLRTDPELSRFVHATSPSLEAQLAWMRAYEERAGDYYFVVWDRHGDEPVGTIGLYDVVGDTAEWGRWLIRPGSLAAVESALLIYRFGFERLALQRLCCRTLVDNARVVSFHDSMGALRTGILPGYAELPDGRHDAIEHSVDAALWAALRPRLEQFARRVAGG